MTYLVTLDDLCRTSISVDAPNEMAARCYAQSQAVAASGKWYSVLSCRRDPDTVPGLRCVDADAAGESIIERAARRAGEARENREVGRMRK